MTEYELDDAGFTDWSPELNTVWRGRRFDETRPVTEVLDEHDDELPKDWP